MRRKQNLDVRQDVPASSTALQATETLEQQVRAHPVVREAMRLFDARLVAVSSCATRETPRHLLLERGISSQEAKTSRWQRKPSSRGG
jgi:lipopolysaccharide biosynthesis regulator YciM